jgi:preprotein translocase subunit YajC
MFELEAIAAMKMKLGIFVLALLAALVLYFNYQHMQKLVAKANTTITEQHTEIVSQADTIKTDGIVKKIDEDTQVALQKDEKAVAVKHESIQQKVVEKEHVIQQHFEALPVSPENLAAEQEQLSESRIDALWEAYCAATPAAAQCQPTKG